MSRITHLRSLLAFTALGAVLCHTSPIRAQPSDPSNAVLKQFYANVAARGFDYATAQLAYTVGQGAGGLTIGAPVTGCSTNGFVFYNNSNLLGCELVAGTGTVTNTSGTPGNGFNPTFANGTTTPVLTIATTGVTGMVKDVSNGLVSATPGTDYLAPNGSGAALTGLVWSQIGSTPTTLAGYGITTPISPAQGGTGVNNGANTISTSLNFAITGSGAQTFFFGNSGVPWTYNFPQVSGNLAYQTGALVSGHCLQASGTAGGIADAGAVCGSGGSGITTLTGDVAAGPGSGSQAATLATVNGNVGSFTSANITVNAKGLITAAANGSGGATFANPIATAGPAAVNGSATTAMRSDAAPLIQKAGASQFGIMEPGISLLCPSGVCDVTAPVEAAKTVSFSVAAVDMGNTIPVNISGGGTVTLPIFSTPVFAAGQTLYLVNIGATADTITNSTGGTMFPSFTSLPPGATLNLQSDGSNLYASMTLQSYSGSGTVTTTGSPASGDIAAFSGATSITTATATGTGSVVRATSPTLVTPALGTPSALTLTNATGLPDSGIVAQTANTVMGALTATTPSGLALPSCVDTAGNHLNYTSGTGFSCGTSGGGGGSLTVTDGTHSVTSTTTLTAGPNFVVGGSAGSATLNSTYPIETTETAVFSFAAGDMGKTIPVNISGGGAITIPSSGFGTTIFGAGQTACVQNTGATADTFTNSSSGTIAPALTTLQPGETICFTGDGTNLFATLSEAPIVPVLRGGTGLATQTASAIYKGNGTSPPAVSSISDNGTLVAVALAAGSTPVALTDGSTIAVLGSGAGSSNNFSLTLTANGHTISNITSPIVGYWYDFLITGAGFTNSWGTAYLWAAGSPPTYNASGATEVSCKTLATSGANSLLCYGPVNSAVSQAQVSAPTAPANTTTYFMQGLAGAITPKTTGNVEMTISGTIVDPSGTAAGNGIVYQLSYGTGTAPANAAALTGTQVGTTQTFTSPTTVIAADVNQPFSTQAIVTGLTPGTAYWVDLAAKSIATASSMGLANLSISVREIR